MKRTAAIILTFALICSSFFCVSAYADEKQEEIPVNTIYDLKTNDLTNPEGTDTEKPVFSWKMKSEWQGEKQSAYRIEIAEDSSFSNIFWDSGKTEDDRSTGIVYAGDKEIKKTTPYYWRVSVWDQNDEMTVSDTAYFSSGLFDNDDWENSIWISAKKTFFGSNKGSPVFRKEITPSKEIESVKLYASALGIYDISIDGARVGTKMPDGSIVYDELKPGYTHYPKHAVYNTYDVTDMFTAGKASCISAQVNSGWWSGAVSGPFWASFTDKFAPFLNFSYGKKPAFRAELLITYADGSNETIGTDTTWKAAYAGPVTYGDIYGGETYNANADTSYKNSGFDDSKWKNAKENTEFKGELTALMGSPVRLIKELKPVSVTIYDSVINKNSKQYGKINIVKTCSGNDEFTLEAGQTAVVDMGQNFAGGDHFTVSGEKDTEITLRHGEMLNDSNGLKSRGCDGPEGSIYTANLRRAKATGKYILNGSGNEEYLTSTSFYGYRYLEITADNSITFHKISGPVFSSVNDVTGKIETSDEDVNKLISNIMWGQYSNYLSVPTDCPQRDERKGWTADAQVFSTAACYNADSKGFLSQFMRCLNDSQIEGGKDDGAFPDTAPYNRYGEIGQLGWADAGIIIPYNIYKMYGDKSIIEECWPYMQKYMDTFMATTEKLGGRHNHGDWLAYEGNDDDLQNIFGTAYYAWDAQMMATMADVLGKAGDAEKYRALYEDEKAFFIENFVNEDGTLKRTEQTACLMALKFDLLPDTNSRLKVKNDLVKNIERNGDKLQTGFLGTAIILETLSDIDEDELAYKLLLQHGNPSWLYSVDQGATTVWERWNSYTVEDGFGDVAMNSFNHYAYGAVAEWLYGYMGGIRYDISNPGFKHIILKPCPDKSLNFADCSYDSAYGPIKSFWRYEDGKFIYEIEIPANTEASVYIPSWDENITINGIDISHIQNKNITYKGLSGGKAEFNVLSGKYTFVANA